MKKTHVKTHEKRQRKQRANKGRENKIFKNFAK